MKKIFLILILMLIMPSVFAASTPITSAPYQRSLISDFKERSALPQSDISEELWYTPYTNQIWGPMPRQYPPIDYLIAKLPKGIDVKQWKRDRVVAIAKQYINLPYRHHHIPAWNPQTPDKDGKIGPGLDCSNFTSWVYNFGFGIMLNSDITKQSQMLPRFGYVLPDGMQILDADEDFLPGDLLFITREDIPEVSHAVIYIDEEHIVDSHKECVAIRPFEGWYKTHLSHGIRVFN